MQYTHYTLAEDKQTISCEVVTVAEVDGFMPTSVLLVEQASSYARDLRGIVRALWNGTMDFDQAFSLFQDTIRFHLTRAWYEGAKQCGIQPNELTPEELTEIQNVIYSESSHVFGFLDYVEQNSKANGGKFTSLLSRVETWALRYPDVINRAKLMACGDQKLVWVRGPTSDSCVTCLSMDGKVKRASYWVQHGPHPQHPPNPTIQCAGWKCLCSLEVTDLPLSRGPLPRWP